MWCLNCIIADTDWNKKWIQKNEGSYTQRILIYLCGRKIPIRACSHMIPYNATPIFWWWLLKVLLKFLIDSTAPAVARSKASVCYKQRQKLIQYTFEKKNAYLSWGKSFSKLYSLMFNLYFHVQICDMKHLTLLLCLMIWIG